MSSLGSPSTLFLAKKKAYEVERSLRFNKSDLAYLGRTPSSTGNQKVWTWSCWFKRTKLGDSSYFLSSYGNNDGIAAIYFDSDDPSLNQGQYSRGKVLFDDKLFNGTTKEFNLSPAQIILLYVLYFVKDLNLFVSTKHS